MKKTVLSCEQVMFYGAGILGLGLFGYFATKNWIGTALGIAVGVGSAGVDYSKTRNKSRLYANKR